MLLCLSKKSEYLYNHICIRHSGKIYTKMLTVDASRQWYYMCVLLFFLYFFFVIWIIKKKIITYLKFEKQNKTVYTFWIICGGFSVLPVANICDTKWYLGLRRERGKQKTRMGGLKTKSFQKYFKVTIRFPEKAFLPP